MLKIWLSVLCVWFGLACAAFAQERPSEERMALAREVLVLSGGEASFTGMIDQMRPLMLQDLRARGVSEEMAQRIINLTTEEYAREAPRFVELGAIAYANAFTDQELRDIADFLRTPSGRSMSAHQTEIAGAMMQAGAIIGQEVGLRVMERVRTQPAPDTP
jgi:hypothetical protein